MAVQAQPFLFPMCGSQDFIPNFSDLDHHLPPCFPSFHDSHPHISPPNTLLLRHLQTQRQELDAILQLQNERLRMALQEQRKQQIGVLLKVIEARATSMLRRKQDEMALAARKKAELEACLSRAEAEKDTWQRLAMEKEAAVADLKRQLERMRGGNDAAAEDAESSAGDDEWDGNGNGNGGGGCKRCGIGEACMVFLPCRHVCSCKDCEGFLAICPVCTSLKEATLEVFFSSASVN